MANNEIKMSPDRMIISKTDAQGKIIYVNKEFRKISGFGRTELIGKPHNIIRHPKMPRGVFKLFWQTIQSGKEFNGFVKNRCKNNDYYWVFASVNPWFDTDGKTLKGYFSARRAPSKEGLKFFSDLYQKMLVEEAKASKTEAASQSLDYLNNFCLQQEVSYDQLAVQYQTR